MLTLREDCHERDRAPSRFFGHGDSLENAFITSSPPTAAMILDTERFRVSISLPLGLIAAFFFSSVQGTWNSALANTAAPVSQSSVVVALTVRAADELAAGEFESAAAALERALRLEPRNARLWHYLSETYLYRGDYQQAEALARKSAALAGDDTAMNARNAWMIAAVRHAAGKPIEPDHDACSVLEVRLAETLARIRDVEVQRDALARELNEERRARQRSDAALTAAHGARTDDDSEFHNLQYFRQGRELEHDIAGLVEALDAERASNHYLEDKVVELGSYVQTQELEIHRLSNALWKLRRVMERDLHVSGHKKRHKKKWTREHTANGHRLSHHGHRTTYPHKHRDDEDD